MNRIFVRQTCCVLKNFSYSISLRSHEDSEQRRRQFSNQYLFKISLLPPAALSHVWLAGFSGQAAAWKRAMFPSLQNSVWALGMETGGYGSSDVLAGRQTLQTKLRSVYYFFVKFNFSVRTFYVWMFFHVVRVSKTRLFVSCLLSVAKSENLEFIQKYRIRISSLRHSRALAYVRTIELDKKCDYMF